MFTRKIVFNWAEVWKNGACSNWYIWNLIPKSNRQNYLKSNVNVAHHNQNQKIQLILCKVFSCLYISGKINYIQYSKKKKKSSSNYTAEIIHRSIPVQSKSIAFSTQQLKFSLDWICSKNSIPFFCSLSSSSPLSSLL